MFTRFDANKSTKGASKLRRDLINAEIANLRELLPLPPSTRQRLSQLQLMALVCVYVRKANYFQQAFKCHEVGLHQVPTPNIGFSKALSGFLMMMTQNGKLLYISDNAAEYLGHSMVSVFKEDLLIHGDSVYDIIDKQDHQAIQCELGRPISNSSVNSNTGNGGVGTGGTAGTGEELRLFLCRMNVSRNARRQMRFGDQKVVLVQGRYLSFLPLCSRNEPVFLATCTPVAMPETRECVVQGATNVFTSIHSMDMRFIHIDTNGEFYLGFSRADLQGVSWYRLLHWDCTREAQTKHRLITQSEQERSCILLAQFQRRTGDWLWLHCVLQVKESGNNTNSSASTASTGTSNATGAGTASSNSADGTTSTHGTHGQHHNTQQQQPVIVCTNQVLSEAEALVMRTNGWLYHYYSVQSKLQYGLAYDVAAAPTAASRLLYYPEHHQGTEFPNTHDPTPIYNHLSPMSNIPLQQQPQPHLIHHHSTNTSTHHNHHHPTNHHHHNNNTHYHQHQHHQHQHHHNQSQPQQHHQHQHHQQQQQHHHQHQHHHAEPVDYSHNSKRKPVPSAQQQQAQQQQQQQAQQAQSQSSQKASVLHHSLQLEMAEVDVERDGGDSSGVAVDSDGLTNVGGGGGSVGGSSGLLVLSHGGVLAERSRTLLKVDPSDLMDQWNPSPPWSDTLQKVPDLCHQELSPVTTLSPYINSAPPTPTATPSVHSGNAFSFDWMPEQYVPNLTAVSTPTTTATMSDDDHTLGNGSGVVTVMSSDATMRHQQHDQHQHHHNLHHHHHLSGGGGGALANMATSYWPMVNEQHRLFPLQPPPKRNQPPPSRSESSADRDTP